MVLDKDEDHVLDEIISFDGAWIPMQYLATEVVNRLVRYGLVVIWETDSLGNTFTNGPFVTLTAWGAMLKGVVLFERVEGHPRWLDRRRAERSERNHRPFREGCWASLSFLEFPRIFKDQIDQGSYVLDENGKCIYLFDNVPIRIDPRLSIRKKCSKRRPRFPY